MSKSSVVVEIESGSIVGFRKTPEVMHFRGVPYAAAPFGENRFKVPQPHPGWKGERDATVTGATSPQLEPAFRGRGFNYRSVFCPGWVHGDEILNLNIWTPNLTGRAPVMVYIHGGAFDHGNGAVPMYDGTRFASSGVVIVSINYRLGFEGFLRLQGGDANVGLSDQMAALAWIQRNIDRFGGDAQNVTIFGESAGAASINLLLTAPGAKSLFHKAISQSGLAPSAPSIEFADAVAEAVAHQLGCEPTVDAFRSLAKDQLLGLQATVAANNSSPLLGKAGTLLARPHADGKVIPHNPKQAFIEGSSAGKKVIWGFNTDEATLFTVPNGLHDKATMQDVREYAAGVHDEPERLIGFLQETLGSGATPGQIRDRIQTWAMFGAGTVWTAGQHSENGNDAWLYEFTWKTPQMDNKIGASHLVELPFVFNNLDHPNIPAMLGDAAPQSLADDMHGRWVAFAKSGDPGWPQFDRTKAVSMTFDEESQLEEHRHDVESGIWNNG